MGTKDQVLMGSQRVGDPREGKARGGKTGSHHAALTSFKLKIIPILTFLPLNNLIMDVSHHGFYSKPSYTLIRKSLQLANMEVRESV